MARKQARAATEKKPLPSRGDAFLMPLADGRFGVCRVIRASSPDEQARQGAPHVLAAASSWIGNEAPDVNNPQLREILTLTHHSWNNRPEIIWISDPVPDSFRLLGIIEPTDAEERMECPASSSWGSFMLQLLMQWQWDTEREAVIREDEKQRELKRIANIDSQKKYRERLASLTLSGLLKKRRFSDWKGFVPDKLIAACRKIFRETISSLIKLGANPSKRSVIKLLKQCIVRLNDLDREHGHFIDTISRENLSEEFDEIVYASGLHEFEDLAGRWRDW